MRKPQLGALMVVFALAAAACGGSSSGKANDGNLIDKDVKSEIANQQASTSTTGATSVKEPTTIAEWETLWASQRASIGRMPQMKIRMWGQNHAKASITP